MKNLLIPAFLLFLAGCDYEVPLSQNSSSDANPALAGIWSAPPSAEKPMTMKISLSGGNYSVVYSEEGGSVSFEGFEIKAGGLNLIQLKLEDAGDQKYLFVKYEITPAGLTVHRLNPEVVSAKCKTTDELFSALTVHRQNPFLFHDPLAFVRSE